MLRCCDFPPPRRVDFFPPEIRLNKDTNKTSQKRTKRQRYDLDLICIFMGGNDDIATRGYPDEWLEDGRERDGMRDEAHASALLFGRRDTQNSRFNVL